jgi:hypothetical protein
LYEHSGSWLKVEAGSVVELAVVKNLYVLFQWGQVRVCRRDKSLVGNLPPHLVATSQILVDVLGSLMDPLPLKLGFWVIGLHHSWKN